MSGTELIIIVVVALLVLGPKKLPDLARSAGKALREFRKATEGIRSTVEQEFYKMDQDMGLSDAFNDHEPSIKPPNSPTAPALNAPLPSPATSVPVTSAPPAMTSAAPKPPPADPGDKK